MASRLVVPINTSRLIFLELVDEKDVASDFGKYCSDPGRKSSGIGSNKSVQIFCVTYF